MAIFLPRKWRRQPVGPVGIDWNNPLAEGLVCAVNGNGQPYDVVNGRNTSAGNYGYGYGAYGQRLETVASTGSQQFIGKEYQQIGSRTLFSWSQAAAGAYLAETAQSNGGINTPFELLLVGTPPKVYWSSAHATDFRIWQSDATFAYNTDYKICVVAAADMSVPPNMYVDNVLQTNTATGTGTGAPTASTTNRLSLGKREDGGAGAVKSYLFLMWSRLLYDWQVAELNENPWALFAPLRGRAYFNMPAAGGFFSRYYYDLQHQAA